MSRSTIYILLLCVLLLAACNQKKPVQAEQNAEPKTPVTVTVVTMGAMCDSISLSAVTSFLKKNSVKSSALGYVEKVNVKIGDYVEVGQILFTIKTKEASVYTSKTLDSVLSFNGKFDIKANSTGIISEVDKQADDYIADGDQLCVIAQKSSLVFLLNVPFEYNRFVTTGSSCTAELPDRTLLPAVIDSRLSAVDATSQTQPYVVKTASDKNLPENLIVKIRIPKTIKQNTISLPKDAVLTDETEADFWVMKMLNDSVAVKVTVIKGIETDTRVEIISPKFSASDKIVLKGNYGLTDTALVQVSNTGSHE